MFSEAATRTKIDQCVVVHADDSWYAHVLNGKAAFFEKLGAGVMEYGYQPLIVRDQEPLSLGLLAGQGPHIMLGPKRHQSPNILHAHPSYIRNYWYFDPKGFFWNSSLADTSFNAQDINPEVASRFFDDLSRRMLAKNLSKRAQKDREPGKLAPADAVVITQDIEKYRSKVHYLTTEQMIEVTAQVARRVYVKLHPLQSPARRAALTTFCQTLPNVELSDASIHDLVEASCAVVTQNSAVGFEALLQEKPVVTCALCDYHHATQTCRTEADLRFALGQADDFKQDLPFAAYVYWFLGLHMLKPQDSDFTQLALARLFPTG